MIDEQISFAIRVCAFAAAFLCTVILSKELGMKIYYRRFNAAFLLVVAFTLIAVGLTAMTAWSTVYTFTRVTGRPAEWMLDNPVVPGYTMFMVASAMVAFRAITISTGWAMFAAAAVVASGVGAYIWIGSYL